MTGGNGSEARESRVDLAEAPDFDLGGLRVSPARRQVGMNGDCQELEPKVMQVLVALASERPRVVSRDRLIERCWNGRIVGDDALNRCIVALRHLARDVSPEPFRIETVPRVGYCLVERPRPTDEDSRGDEPAKAAPTRSSWTRKPRIALAALLVAALGLALFFFALPERGGPAEAAPASIAVLPFRNLSSGDPHFAEGVAEEILTQLSREPGLRIAGRTSSWQFREAAADLREVGRRLDVDHVLEGSVRRSGNRVRVDVALVRAHDGTRVWSQTFDGTLDDIFAMQNSIGASVAGALRRRFVNARPLTGPLTTSGQVYSLYLSARGLIRERNPQAMNAAREKLLRALELDPNFAPAWSSLAQVRRWGQEGPEGTIRRRAAMADARRALALAPDLPEAHGVLGMLLGFDHPLGARHIKRAAALDPNNAEFQFWLGHVYASEGDFPRMLDAYRRAYAIDPLWGYAQEYVVTTAWQMGYRDEALGYVRRVESDGTRYQAHEVRACLAAARGDFSEMAREYAAAAAATSDPGRRVSAEWSRGLAFRKLRLFDAARRVWGRLGAGQPPLNEEPYFAIRQGQLPPLVELGRRNSNASSFFEDGVYTAIAAKLLINAGRARDVVRLYDGDGGILQISRDAPPALPAHVFDDGPLVAIALREVGRRAESERILVHVEREIDAALQRSRGRAPAWFFAGAAQTWALQGRSEAALSALELAWANGWVYVSADMDDRSLPDIGDEPAFRSLRGDPRFERIRTRLNAHLARERREAAQLST